MGFVVVSVSIHFLLWRESDTVGMTLEPQLRGDVRGPEERHWRGCRQKQAYEHDCFHCRCGGLAALAGCKYYVRSWRHLCQDEGGLAVPYLAIAVPYWILGGPIGLRALEVPRYQDRVVKAGVFLVIS